uniref:S8 family serine peptidase n=1 Tax=Paractinoplanes polyasparticus TaxID=2856853 RepID=UPI001C856441|nr:S8 family serine peptidase [Actinoplanes polyasparticus]
MRRRRVGAVVVALGTVAALVAGPPAVGAEAVAPAAAPAEKFMVTLITGDRVTVAGPGVTVEPGPGRAGIRFSSRLVDGHRHVVPLDAMPLLRQGRLDGRLFDLTTLKEFGYTGDNDLPLLLAYPKRGQRKGPAGVRAAVGATARVGRDLAGSGLLAARASRSERGSLWTSLTRGTPAARTLSPDVDRIFLDGKRTPSLDVSVPQIGAPAAWQQGLDGTGVTVAVVDTGIDTTHPDFAGKIVASANFTELPGIDDRLGHGTHVASIIAGSGAKSGGRYQGVAPGAKLAIAKACERSCFESELLPAMEWAAQQAPVVNVSIGGTDYPGIDPLEQAVEDLTAAYGTLFVVSAGNFGFGRPETVYSPASAPAALAVGSVDDRDQLAVSSGRGPGVDDGAIKPDLTAPGVNIVAARAANGEQGGPAADGYVAMSGTSMAAPHVAGAAAILTQQHPGWSPSRRKAALMGAAQPTTGLDVFAQGAGRVDVARAVRQPVTVDEGSVNFGRQEWPHSDDIPISRTLTYRNGGSAPIVLDLTTESATSTFSVTPASLTVPAGGAATATVVADTSGDGTDGFQQGRVVATGAGNIRLGTPMAVNRDVERYDVTFRHINRAGAPDPDGHWGFLVPLDRQSNSIQVSDGADETVSLPRGSYGFHTEFYDTDATSALVHPKLVVDRKMTVTLDARTALPVTVTAPRADARQAATFVTAMWTPVVGGLAGATSFSYVPDDLRSARVGSGGSADEFTTLVNSVFARWKNDDEGFRDSPFTYETAYSTKGDFPTGFRKQIRAGELATVKARYAREADEVTGAKSHRPEIGGWSGGAEALPFTLPFERTEYVGGDSTVGWRGEFQQQRGYEILHRTVGPRQILVPGTVYPQSWNTPVFAPSVATDDVTGTVIRTGDTVGVGFPLFADGSGRWGATLTPDTHRTALYAGDTLIGDSGDDFPAFEVPAGRTAYRLEASATRSAPFRLSTSVSGVWTFASTSGDRVLPLSSIRFSPGAGARTGSFAIPVTVDRAPGSAAASNRTLTAEFSTDDGRTWQTATVSRDRGTVRVTNPSSGFVSLRATATDTAGNTAAVTVIRAYEVA